MAIRLPWCRRYQVCTCGRLALGHFGGGTDISTRAKADCCVIPEGPQGIRKSSALRTNAGEYFTDELVDLGSQDAAMQMRGVWIIELSELNNLSHVEVARIMAFISRTTDCFRPPYGIRLVQHVPAG